MKKSISLVAAFLLAISVTAQTKYPVNSGGLSTPEQWEGDPQISFGFAASLPKSASLKSFCPIPGDQGQLATCTGWSVAYGARTILLAKSENAAKPNTVFDPMYLFNSLKGDSQPKCDYGVELGQAVEFMVNHGTAPMNDILISCDDSVTAVMKKAASGYRIKGYQTLFQYNEPDADAKVNPVKEALTNGNPVVCNILMYFPPRNPALTRSYEPTFWYVKELWEPTDMELDYEQSEIGGPHNMVIVGYDDEKFGGAFEIMNSYGPGWGNGGFFWIKYEDFYYVANAGMSVY